MTNSKPDTRSKAPMRERVLDAAERLLAGSGAAFSMRQLAEEAGVSFATPFNQFGSKAAIMLALSARRIAAMNARLAEAGLPESAPERVLAAIDIATAVMLEAPAVNRLFMGAISAPSEETGDVSSHSAALWTAAVGSGDGLIAASRPLALAVLPTQLAVAFRGVLSFWAAGEIPDDALNRSTRAAAATVLLGFVAPDKRGDLLALIGQTH